MIIASPAKKELAIQLQVLQPPAQPVSSTQNTKNASSFSFVHEYNCQHQDIVTFTKRDKARKHDWVSQVFGSLEVEELMVISTPALASPCQAFISDSTVFLSAPVILQDGCFQSCITHLLELAEEKTGCENLVVVIDRRNLDTEFKNLLRAYMYSGFQMVNPSVYGQEPGFVLLGYEL
jgi:hypothetical protein